MNWARPQPVSDPVTECSDVFQLWEQQAGGSDRWVLLQLPGRSSTPTSLWHLQATTTAATTAAAAAATTAAATTTTTAAAAATTAAATTTASATAATTTTTTNWPPSSTAAPAEAARSRTANVPDKRGEVSAGRVGHGLVGHLCSGAHWLLLLLFCGREEGCHEGPVLPSQPVDHDGHRAACCQCYGN